MIACWIVVLHSCAGLFCYTYGGSTCMYPRMFMVTGLKLLLGAICLLVNHCQHMDYWIIGN